MINKLILIVLLSGLSASSLAYTAADVNAGKNKSATCEPCHTKNGNSVVPAWPKIAGQHYSYALEQLLEFKKGEQGQRFDPVMYGIVAAMTEQDLKDLAAFFAAQAITIGTADHALVALGKKIYQGGNPKSAVPACGPSCHGPKGLGNAAAKIPRLSGQHAEYTISQLKKYRSGARSADLNEIMQDIAKKMTDEEINAVSSYIAGLH